MTTNTTTTNNNILAPGENNLFMKMSRGEVPCYKIGENDYWFAFLDINPLSQGHCLIVPKTPAKTTNDIPKEYMSAFGEFLLKIVNIICPNGEAYNILQNNGEEAGQQVMQVHYHIIPKGAGLVGGAGLSVEWLPHRADDGELQRLSEEYREKYNNI